MARRRSRARPERSTSTCGPSISLPGGEAGFHTTRWARAFEDATRAVVGEPPVVPPFAASLGPDVQSLENVASSEATRVAADAMADTVGDRLVVFRNDRIEPSKN